MIMRSNFLTYAQKQPGQTLAMSRYCKVTGSIQVQQFDIYGTLINQLLLINYYNNHDGCATIGTHCEV